MKYTKKQIIELREQGMTIREIQKELGISSPSVVHHHLKKFEGIVNKYVLPKRFPKAGDTESELMCTGFNEYRRLIIKKIEDSLNNSKDLKKD